MTLRTAAVRAAAVEATAVKHASAVDLGVDSAEVAKLPKEIEPREVNNCTYVYRDAMEMIEDMRRLRRKSGWKASWVRTDEKFIFHMTDFDETNPDLEPFAQFEVKVSDVLKDFWPGKYPKDPVVPKLRQWFLMRRGCSNIANLINETHKEAQLPETASRWSRLLGDDDLV